MQSVQVVEVAPRDGLQNEHAILPTEAKLELSPRWPRPACGGSR
jgi:isopropylmalate/homocitrate/citramalate synthase